MRERAVYLLWCEGCCNRHWDRMDALGEAGRLTAKSGTLKVSIACESCWKKLTAGEQATAFTIDGGADYVPWEDMYLELDPEWDDEARETKNGREMMGRRSDG